MLFPEWKKTSSQISKYVYYYKLKSLEWDKWVNFILD